MCIVAAGTKIDNLYCAARSKQLSLSALMRRAPVRAKVRYANACRVDIAQKLNYIRLNMAAYLKEHIMFGCVLHEILLKYVFTYNMQHCNMGRYAHSLKYFQFKCQFNKKKKNISYFTCAVH